MLGIKTEKIVTFWHMTPTLPLGHEPVESLQVERLEAEWRFRVIHERNSLLSIEVSFFAMPLKRQVDRPLQTSAIRQALRQAQGHEQSRRTH
jgi:hypothetical protein